jgi:ABC-type transport system substrate-binding protein
VGAQRDRPAADLKLRPLRALTFALTLAAAALAPGCGGDEPDRGGDALPDPGDAGALVYAVERLPGTLDPLEAESRAAQLVTRQIHEPLVASLSGPYGDEQPRPGLALTVTPSAGGTVWRAVLRPGVRFQDGSAFNAAAVQANARRWTSGAGEALLPALFAVDTPRPDEVRFLFESPVRDVRRRLASPRLGIVSPRGLDVTGRAGGRFLRSATRTGTGPFEFEVRTGRRLELSRDPGWWGTTAGLGPALDRVTFRASPSEAGRVELLTSGEAKVAEPFAPAALASLAAQPLLRVLPSGGGTGVGFEASVRGLEPLSGGVPLLSRVWLTTIGG